MIQADVNRDRRQYEETDDDRDARLISYLIDVLVAWQTRGIPTCWFVRWRIGDRELESGWQGHDGTASTRLRYRLQTGSRMSILTSRVGDGCTRLSDCSQITEFDIS